MLEYLQGLPQDPWSLFFYIILVVFVATITYRLTSALLGIVVGIAVGAGVASSYLIFRAIGFVFKRIRRGITHAILLYEKYHAILNYPGRLTFKRKRMGYYPDSVYGVRRWENTGLAIDLPAGGIGVIEYDSDRKWFALYYRPSPLGGLFARGASNTFEEAHERVHKTTYPMTGM